MDLFGTGHQDITNLSSLLNESRQSQELAANRGSQPPIATNVTNVVLNSAPLKQVVSLGKQEKSKDIWETTEIPLEDAIADTSDTRPSPRYEVSYQQSVGSEDTFLGLSDKTPLSADCTHIVVKVHFPGCTMKDLDLDVTKNRLKVTSKAHKLITYLPVEVVESKGNAKFDPKKEVLIVTLPIDRGY